MVTRPLHRGQCTIAIATIIVVVVAGVVSTGNSHAHANDDASTPIEGGSSGHQHHGHDDNYRRRRRTRTVDYAGNSNYWRPTGGPDGRNNNAPENDLRDAVVDEHLITNFLQTYKHINGATLLVCPFTDALSPPPPPAAAPGDSNRETSSNNGGGGGDGGGFSSSERPFDAWPPATTSSLDDVTPPMATPTPTPTPQLRSSSVHRATSPATPARSFINVAKHLMAAGILIKAWDIDSFRGAEATQTDDGWRNGTGTTSLPINRKAAGAGAAAADAAGETDGSDGRGTAARLHNMLKCGTFKQAIVLDLTCRKSKWLLQQVR